MSNTPEQAKTNILEKFVYCLPFEIFILSLVILSISLLIYEKIFDLNPAVYDIFEIIDLVVMIIFAFEFITKLVFRRGKYFLGDYGWIDLLSIIPIFSPALKVLRGVKLLRGMRLVKALRLLRILRILKVAKKTESVLKQKVFVPTSSVIMIISLVLGFFLVSWQEDTLKRFDEQEFNRVFQELKDLPEETVLQKNEHILAIKKENRIIAYRYTPEEIAKNYIEEQYTTINKDGYEITFSVMETYRMTERIELVILLITILTIIILIIILNMIIDRIVLGPLAKLSQTMDRVVYDVKIPNTDEIRKEIDFNIEVKYQSNDEIGSLADKYNFLIKTLKQKNQQSKSIFRRLVNSMMNIFAEFHNITRGHQVRAARVASAIGYGLGLAEEDRESLYFGMMLHDLGKVGVDKNVLTKPGKFSEHEKAEMERHPEIGFEIAKDFPLISLKELTVIKEHHEKYDGSGYPARIEGKKLSILSRIGTVADIFDALSCPRDYKSAKPLDQVMAIMDTMSGEYLDPQVYNTLKDLIKKGIIIVNISDKNPEEEWITVNEKKLGAKVSFKKGE